MKAVAKTRSSIDEGNEDQTVTGIASQGTYLGVFPVWERVTVILNNFNTHSGLGTSEVGRNRSIQNNLSFVAVQ